MLIVKAKAELELLELEKEDGRLKVIFVRPGIINPSVEVSDDRIS